MLPSAPPPPPPAPRGGGPGGCEGVVGRRVGAGGGRGGGVRPRAAGDRVGGYAARASPFTLTGGAPGRAGISLRATDEAINVIVGARDRDIESAQAAAGAKLDTLVRRNRLSEARTAAEEARLRTVQ